MKELKNLLAEWNDSPKDFLQHMFITIVVAGVWGLVMGIMEEYR